MYIFPHRLTLAHSKVDTEIRREQKRAVPDLWRLLRLKKIRLAIKDRMHQLTLTLNRGQA